MSKLIDANVSGSQAPDSQAPSSQAPDSRSSDTQPVVSHVSLSTLAIRQHIATLMLTLVVIVLGCFFTIRLPVDLLPSITYPRIGVRADAPGISPEVAVDEVTRPLEQALSATEGVVQVISQTREGRVSLDLYFRPGGNIDQALNDATATLNRARNQLPDTIEQPQLFKFDPSQLPVYELALTSMSLSEQDLRIFADEELARELNTVSGVASVDISGGLREEIQINLNPQRLQALGLGLTDVLSALDERNLDTAGGRLPDSSSESLTRVSGRFTTVEEIRDLSLSVGDVASPQQIRLQDVAEIIDGAEEQRVLVNLNSQPAVKVSVQKQPDANTIAVVDGVKQRLATLSQSGALPDDMVLNVTLDESVFIRNAISNVIGAGLGGAVLAGIVVFLFLGSLRQTFIIMLAIPLATLTALLLMGLFGLSLNVFSLGGLAMGVGIVVDNAIVILENITQGIARANIKQGGKHSRKHSSKPGGKGKSQNGHGDSPQVQTQTQSRILRQAEVNSQELEATLVAATTTNLVAVIPFLLIGGFISLLFNELILTISFAVATSLVVAVTVVPALAARLLAIPGSSGAEKWWLIQQFQMRLQGLTRQYQQGLQGVIRYRMGVVAIATLVLLGSSFWMLRQIPQEILPSINTGQASLRAQFPAGTTLDQNRTVMAAVDQLLLDQPETDYVFTTAGGSLFGINTSENVLRGSSTITFAPGTDVEAFSERMNNAFNQFNLVDTQLRISPSSVRGLILNNSPVRADIDIVLQSADTQALNQAGQQLLETLQAQATLARYLPDADPPQPELQIRPDWVRAGDLGLSAQAIGQTVQTLLQGSIPTQLQRQERLIDVRVQMPTARLQNLSDLEQLPLFINGGQPVRLREVAQIQVGQSSGEIQRINQRQVFIIEGSLAEDANLSDALVEVDRIMASVTLPGGVTRLPSFSTQNNQQLQSSLKILGVLATFLVFAVMAVQYNSLIDPLVIILTVPLALAGGILGLFVTQTAIGATVIVGVVLLVGIVVNNAIIMVELANEVYEQTGCSRKAAILQAAPQRLRPILMTALTSALGLFPLALGIGEGSEFLQPLGVVIFWGLSLSTVLTLFMTPCLYVMLHGWQPARRLI